jgi:transposase
MENKSDTLPDDVEALKSLVRDLQSTVAQQSNFINQLVEQINLARHQRFGASSEKITLDQLGLSFDEAEVTVLAADALAEREQAEENDGDVPVAGHRRRRGGRRPLPPELPRVEVLYALEGEACRCGQCQHELEVIGEKLSRKLPCQADS